MISLSHIDYFNKNQEHAYFRERYRVLNITRAATLIISHGFNALGMERIYGGAIDQDIQTMVCRMLGFKDEGTKRRAIYKNRLS